MQVNFNSTYLDFVHIANSVVKFNRSATFHVCLVSGIAVYHCLSSRRWCESVPCMRRVASTRIALCQRASPLLRPSLEGGILSRGLNKETGAILHWGAKGRLGALDAMLRPLRPLLPSTFLENGLASCSRPMPFGLTSAARDRLNRGAHGRRNSNGVGVISSAAFYAVAWW